jgi:hypothetical protein
MPTIEDLLAEYASRAQSAPTEIGVRDELAGRRSRRPIAAVAGGVGAVAAVAAVAIAISFTSGPRAISAGAPPSAPVSASSHASSQVSVSASTPATKPPVSAASGLLSLTQTRFTVGALPYGLSLQGDELTSGYENMSLGTPANPSSVVVTLVGPGGWHPTIPTGAGAVAVGGRTAHYATNYDMGRAPTGVAFSPAVVAGLSWQDAAGDWVFLGQPISDRTHEVPQPLTEAQLVNLANVVQIGRAHAIRTPIKIGYLPAGVKLDSVDFGPLNEQAWAPAVNLSFGSLEVDVSPGTWLAGVVGPGPDKAPQTSTITINGFSGKYSPQDPRVLLTNGTMSIYLINLATNSTNRASDIEAGNGLPLAEVTRILNGITVTNTPHNTASWYDLATALP